MEKQDVVDMTRELIEVLRLGKTNPPVHKPGDDPWNGEIDTAALLERGLAVYETK